MTARNLGGAQLVWQALLPASALWVAALAVCVISLQLLSGTGQRQTDDRGAKAEAAASEALAADLLHPGSPEFPSTVRALLQRADIRFAYLRVHNAEGVAVASVGRLPQSWPRGIRVSMYQLISTPHSGPLLYKGRQIGSLEYGLFPGGGSG